MSISLFQRPIRGLLFVAAAASFGDRATFGQDPVAVVRQVEAGLKGQTLILRHLVSNSQLKYDERGKLTTGWKPGRWTWHGHAEVVSLQLNKGLLKIAANRILMQYNKSAHQFFPIRSSEKVEIEIRISSDGNTSPDLRRELRKAFLDEDESIPENIEPYWKPFIECVTTQKAELCDLTDFSDARVWERLRQDYGEKSSDPQLYRVGPNLTPPEPRSRVEPVYTEAARRNRATGTVVFSAFIDKEGRVRLLRVIQPVGFGLEESAAEALKKWTFRPAYLQGNPVNAGLHIEVGFDLKPD